MLSPNSKCSAACVTHQDCKCCSRCLRKRSRQQRQCRMAVIECSVCVMEITRVGEKVTELHTAKTVLSPVNLAHRAGPGLLLENWERVFRKLAIEGRMVSSNTMCVAHE